MHAVEPQILHAPLTRVLERSVRRESLVFVIAYELGSAIIEGTLAPGVGISSVDVARRFQTSRAPVRDALLILEREGLVTTSRGRVTRVVTVALAETREIYEIRSTLHALVAERIVRYASDAAIQRLRPIHAQLVSLAAAGSVDAYFWTNLAFRDTEAHVAGNDHLRQLLDSLGLRTLLVRHLGLAQPGRIAQSVSDHARLIEAYESRNELLAVAITRTIVRAGLATIEHASTGSGLLARTGSLAGSPQPVDRHAADHSPH